MTTVGSIWLHQSKQVSNRSLLTVHTVLNLVIHINSTITALLEQEKNTIQGLT